MIKNIIDFEAKTVNGIPFNFDNPVKQAFNNFGEVSTWWSANPTAIRIEPLTNDNIVFPCNMTFVLPL